MEQPQDQASAAGGLSAVDRSVIPAVAVALRPVRFLPGDGLRYYTATTFPRDPRAGCDLYYRRCRAFGGVDGEQAGICDVLDAAGDVVADFPLTAHGLDYLYRALGCLVDGHNAELRGRPLADGPA